MLFSNHKPSIIFYLWSFNEYDQFIEYIFTLTKFLSDILFIRKMAIEQIKQKKATHILYISAIKN